MHKQKTTPEVKIKRKHDVVASYVMTFISAASFVLMLATLKNELVLFFVLLFIFVLGLTFVAVYSKEFVRNMEYYVYEYEVWSNSKQDYVMRYWTGTKILYAQYIYDWHYSNVKEQFDITEIERHITRSELDHHYVKQGFDTKDDAINDIIKKFKLDNTKSLEDNNIIVRNVNVVDRYTNADLNKISKKTD